MKYRLTPFLIFTSISLIIGIYMRISDIRSDVDPGLGGVFPLILFGFAIVLFLLDLVGQILFQNNTKTLFVIQMIVTALLVIGIILTFL